ncbi:MAG TPA: exoribonuclease II [Cyanothece sp. UBA12306]|nr:exoribonuclease II [Cyanothece sp. UBA12306]
MTPNMPKISNTNSSVKKSLVERETVLGFTIDGETSKDLDDAIWVEPLTNGAIISVHISDVTASITPGSSLEKMALSKAETRYLSSRTIPMFPRQFSEDKCSLLEGKLRLTVTVKIKLDNEANIKTTQVLLTQLTSLKQFSYSVADQTLNDPSQPLFQMLRYCELWSQKLAWKRQKSGAIGQTTIAGITLDEEGRLIETPLYQSQKIIQEFMILANTAIAKLAQQHQLSILYRNHQASIEEDLLEKFQDFNLPESLRNQLKSCLNPADYSSSIKGHFALSLPCYTHFTSPIRRAADYLNHRLIKDVLIDNKNPSYTEQELEDLANQINQKRLEMKEKRNQHFREQRLSQCQKTLERPSYLEYLSPKEFSQILKDSLKLSQLDPLVPEIEKRLKKRELTAVDLYYIIWGEYQEANYQKLMVDELMNYLEENPPLATQILQIAATMSQTLVDYIEKKGKSDTFVFWTIFAAKTTSLPAQGTNKTKAKHKANRLWIKAKLEDTLLESDEIEKEAFTDVVIPDVDLEIEEQEIDWSVIPSDALNSPIAYLYERLQALGLKTPDYFYDKVSEQWQCSCHVDWFDELLVKTCALAETKKEAKAQSSLKIIPILEEYILQLQEYEQHESDLFEQD